MTPLEANKVIAEFIGVTRGYYEGNYYHEDYSESLDALVPVWERLKYFDYFSCVLYANSGWRAVILEGITPSKGKTIQEAAAIATAKAILELKKDA